jgi:uncharacterized membrane protein YukC
LCYRYKNKRINYYIYAGRGTGLINEGGLIARSLEDEAHTKLTAAVGGRRQSF